MKKLGSVKRKVVKLSPAEMVRLGELNEGRKFPILAEPSVSDFNPVEWAGASRAFIEEALIEHGAILFRNFRIGSFEVFGQFLNALSSDLLDYCERAAQRTEVSPKIFTSTEYPPDQAIPLHHEMSYSHNWPSKIWFYCDRPAEQGGRTPIANDREVFRLIDPFIKKLFMEKRVMYVRNYGRGIDLSWQEAFQTSDEAVVEQYCRRAHTEFEWRDKDRLRTRQVRQAVALHPRTGETVWFNHAHLFHISSLDPMARESLLSEFDEDELPRNVFYGDGSPIDVAALDEIRSIYQQQSVRFDWQKGDILMLDNFLASHGREPFKGPRKILVAMAELCRAGNLTEDPKED